MRFLTCLCLLLLSSIATAEVPRVMDTDGPALGVRPLELEELWRAGGEDETVLFGRVVDVVGSGDGTVYVMDNQLCHVSVFAPDGEYLGDLGREGDGPGEVRQPIGVVLMEGGLVGLGSGFPGRVICLNADGTPTDSRFPIGEPADGDIGVMISLQFVDGLLGATGGRLVLDPSGQSDNHAERFLALCDTDCATPLRILQKNTPLDPTGQRYVEREDYYIDRRWALGPGGLVYTAMTRDAYEISVYDRTGELQRVFGRDYEPRKRTDEDKEDVSPIINLVGRIEETVAEDHDPCVSRVLYDFDEDRVWVLEPHGANDQPDGILETWDVFTAEGEYLRRVPIPLGDQMNDGTCYLVGGRRLVVIKGTASDFGGDNAGDGEEDLEEIEIEPLEVICYRIR
ncbi:MAG: hypothetical protein GY838_15130 [bacterium]|nr:hypothetical protein [bacterium]